MQEVPSTNVQQEYPNNGFRSYWKNLSADTASLSGNQLPKWLTLLQTGAKLIGKILNDAGIELLFLLIFWLIITKMGQGRDLIVSLFEPGGIYTSWRIFFTILTVISFSVSMWIIPAFLFQLRDRKNEGISYYHSIFKEHLFFVHRVLPLIPFWLLAFVFFNGNWATAVFTVISLLQLALLFLLNLKIKEPKQRILYAAAVLVLLSISIVYFLDIYKVKYIEAKISLAIILYLISFFMHFIYSEVDKKILEEHKKPDILGNSVINKYKINSWFYLACLLTHAVIVTYIFLAPRLVPIAPESMLLYIFSLYVFIIDLFVYFINVSIRIKVVTTLVILIVFLTYCFTDILNLNVTHYSLDTISDTSVLKGRERLTFNERYADLKERIRSYKGKEPYPIILISGEGGGSRAGMWFSQNLINFDLHTNGQFRDHIFSLSTVSGSSVGLSTVFAFWEESEKENNTSLSWDSLPSKVYANNFVGSSISGLLLTDFWKSFWPFGNSVRDRNSTLQDEEAYYTQKACLEIINKTKGIKPNFPDQCILTKDFMGFFYDTINGELAFKKARPLVFINTCRSNDGRRGIFSPIKLGNDVFNDAIDIAGYLYEDSICNNTGKKLCSSIKRDISLGQACNTSELFPLFSAPTYIDRLGSFVDGGYHENSGLKTTLDVYQMLSDALRKDKDSLNYKIYIIYLKNGSSDKDLYKPLSSETPAFLPLQALFSQPFEGSASYFEERTKYVEEKDSNVKYIEIKLNHRMIVTDLAITNRNSKIEKQIFRDLTGAIDETKQEATLNFPLARWLSKSVIKRMREDAGRQQSQNKPLQSLLTSINSINTHTKVSFKTSRK